MLCIIFQYLAPFWSYSGLRESFVPSYGTDFFFFLEMDILLNKNEFYIFIPNL